MTTPSRPPTPRPPTPRPPAPADPSTSPDETPDGVLDATVVDSRPRRRRLETGLTIGAFLALLLAPWFAGAIGLRADAATENRPLLAAPDLDAGRAFDAQQFAAIEAFATDHLPLRQQSAALINASLYAITGASPIEEAFVTPEGTWSLAEDFLDACIGPFRPDDVADTLREWEAASGGATEILLVVAPDKSAIVPDAPGWRNRLADNCQVEREAQFRTAFAGSDSSVDLWTSLRADATDPATSEPVYFVNDSHWTYHGATAMAEAVVGHFADHVYDPSTIMPERSVTVVGDVTRRLGLERREVVDRLETVQDGVVTSLTVEPAISAEGVRVYESRLTEGAPATSGLVPGRTLVVHDSMGNFAEGVMAPYFERVDFIHWNDVESGGFDDRIAAADRIVFEIVQRDLSPRFERYFLAPHVDAAVRTALAAAD